MVAAHDRASRAGRGIPVGRPDTGRKPKPKNPMNMIKQLAGACTALLLVGAVHGQTTVPAETAPMRTNGVRGNSLAELNYSWVDFSRDRGINADGFILGFDTNTPVAPGFDLGIGYNYYRENGHRNPFNNSEFDARYHQLHANGIWYFPAGAVTPFLSAGAGYQWSHGDIQSLRTYDDMWLWMLGGGIEIPLRSFTITPHIKYSDAFHNNDVSTWHYGAEVHTWFTEKVGGFVDATFHQPHASWRTDSWTYTAGVRFRF
jgi:opacity protein-like surface antigen